jgi:hypothetical protein
MWFSYQAISLFYLPEQVHSVNHPIYKFIQLLLVHLYYWHFHSSNKEEKRAWQGMWLVGFSHLSDTALFLLMDKVAMFFTEKKECLIRIFRVIAWYLMLIRQQEVQSYEHITIMIPFSMQLLLCKFCYIYVYSINLEKSYN